MERRKRARIKILLSIYLIRRSPFPIKSGLMDLSYGRTRHEEGHERLESPRLNLMK
jgi:hypothetical protein